MHIDSSKPTLNGQEGKVLCRRRVTAARPHTVARMPPLVNAPMPDPTMILYEMCFNSNDSWQ